MLAFALNVKKSTAISAIHLKYVTTAGIGLESHFVGNAVVTEIFVLNVMNIHSLIWNVKLKISPARKHQTR